MLGWHHFADHRLRIKMMKTFIFLIALTAAAFAMQTPFWDEFSHSTKGLKVISITMKPCESFPCDLRTDKPVRFSIFFLSRSNYDLGKSELSAVAKNETGHEFLMNFPVVDLTKVVSNDNDGNSTTLNPGGIYERSTPRSPLGDLPVGSYTVEVKLFLDKNKKKSAISHYFFFANLV